MLSRKNRAINSYRVVAGMGEFNEVGFARSGSSRQNIPSAAVRCPPVICPPPPPRLHLGCGWAGHDQATSRGRAGVHGRHELRPFVAGEVANEALGDPEAGLRHIKAWGGGGRQLVQNKYSAGHYVKFHK